MSRLFNGTSSYLQSANVSKLDNTSNAPFVTVAAWVKLNTLGVAQTIVNKGDEDAGGNPFSFRLEINSLNQLNFHVRDGVGNPGNATGSTALNLSTWYWVIGERNTISSGGTTDNVYLNNINDGTDFPPNNNTKSSTGQPLYVGVKRASSVFSNYLSGHLAFLHVFDRLLTNKEMVRLKSYPGSILNGLVLFYPLFGQSPELDYSSNGNVGSNVLSTMSGDWPPIAALYFPQMPFDVRNIVYGRSNPYQGLVRSSYIRRTFWDVTVASATPTDTDSFVSVG